MVLQPALQLCSHSSRGRLVAWHKGLFLPWSPTLKGCPARGGLGHPCPLEVGPLLKYSRTHTHSWGCSSALADLLSMLKALSLSPSTENKQTMRYTILFVQTLKNTSIFLQTRRTCPNTSQDCQQVYSHSPIQEQNTIAQRHVVSHTSMRTHPDY